MPIHFFVLTLRIAIQGWKISIALNIIWFNLMKLWWKCNHVFKIDKIKWIWYGANRIVNVFCNDFKMKNSYDFNVKLNCQTYIDTIFMWIENNAQSEGIKVKTNQCERIINFTNLKVFGSIWILIIDQDEGNCHSLTYYRIYKRNNIALWRWR